MILFNLMFFKDTSNCLRSLDVNSSYFEKNITQPSKSIRRNIGLAYILKNSEILSESKYTLSKKNFEKQNIWRNFFNNIWQQEIFLSANSKALNKYNVEINSFSVNQGQNRHKYLVSKFSKSLFDGSIQSSLAYDVSNYNSSSSDIEYLWGKMLKMQLSSINTLFRKNEYHKGSKKIKNTLDKQINLNYLPLFVVSNNLGQMVISEPPTDLNISQYVKSYTSNINQNSNLYHGFFFTNYEDAQEYMLSIQRYYNLDDKRLKIFTCSFSAFYNIMNKFNHEIYFKLVPDLKEVSELIKKYRYQNNVLFHKKQKYSKSSFQGQPLYFIKDGHYHIPHDLCKEQKIQKYDFLFTSYDDALQFSNRLKSKVSNSKFKKHNLMVYNLEHFIKDQLSVDTNNQTPSLVVPSRTSYAFAKQYKLKQSSQSAQVYFAEVVAYVKLWSKRIFWSLTSRKP